MKALGCYAGHDQAVAVAVDGKVVLACEEERFLRVKHVGQEHSRFPRRGLEWLAQHGYTYDNVDVIAESTPTADSFSRLGAAEAIGIHRSIADRYRQVGHHLCHAATGYFWSGWDDCYALAIDGGGMNYFGIAAKCSGGQIEVLGGEPMTEARTLGGTNPGSFYLHLTMHLGFRGLHDEGKVQALAAHGDPAKYRGLFDSWYDVRPFGVMKKFGRSDESGTMSSAMLHAAVGGRDATLGSERAHLAAAGQEFFERMVLADLEAYVPRGARLVVAGGSFANVSLNRKLLNYASEVWVAPPMTDSGLSAGAAMIAAATKPYRLDNVYLGFDVGPAKADPRAVARLIAEGKCVGLCHGPCEYGPRALGNRSILADPRRAEVVGRLNGMLQRSSVMPFAPVVLDLAADDVLEPAWHQAEHAAEFMTIAFAVRPGVAERIPAVVHADGTARPQVLREAVNPFYYAVLQEFERETGCPVLLNTSANLHSTPIICSIDDANDLLKQHGIDALVSPDGIECA